MIESISLSTGGPGLNLAVNLRQLGAAFPVGMIGAVGDDAHEVLPHEEEEDGNVGKDGGALVSTDRDGAQFSGCNVRHGGKGGSEHPRSPAAKHIK